MRGHNDCIYSGQGTALWTLGGEPPPKKEKNTHATSYHPSPLATPGKANGRQAAHVIHFVLCPRRADDRIPRECALHVTIVMGI